MDKIVAILSDGAAVMELLAKLLGIDQQLCLAHGIHLAVVEVVYDPKKEPEEESILEVEESDTGDSSDDDDENKPEVEITEGEPLELNESIKDLIQRLRKSVNNINKSPVKVWELQEAVKKWQKSNGKKIEELVSFCISIYQCSTGRY